MFRKLSLAAVAALVAMPALACDGFMVDDAFARTSTMMSVSGAAFMVLHNQGSTDCRVVGARSDVAERTELHTHIADANGVMRMVEVEDGFPVPAGSEHTLGRGGDHVMFLGLNRSLAQGDTVHLTLVFEDGSEFALDVPVDNERMPGMGGRMQGHGAMHGQPSN